MIMYILIVLGIGALVWVWGNIDDCWLRHGLGVWGRWGLHALSYSHYAATVAVVAVWGVWGVSAACWPAPRLCPICLPTDDWAAWILVGGLLVRLPA